jgi:hypothetical protein
MDRELLNIEFNKRVKIKPLKSSDNIPIKPKRYESPLYQKCIKLIYYILIVIALFFFIRWGVVATVNFCSGSSYSDFNEMWSSAKILWKEESP